jgi:hypothetical protein
VVGDDMLKDRLCLCHLCDRLGSLESGAVAAATSVQFSIISGGLVCIAGALALAALLPRWRNVESQPQPA